MTDNTWYSKYTTWDALQKFIAYVSRKKFVNHLNKKRRNKV